MSNRLSRPGPSFVAAMLFAMVVAICLRIAWNPPLSTYLDYVPIGAVFMGLLWDRAFTWPPSHGRNLLIDAAVVLLALLRVFIPPLPFVSGHALVAGYASLTAHHWPLRVIATFVTLHVVYTKLFVTGGWWSLVGGLLMAFAAALVRQPSEKRADRPLKPADSQWTTPTH